MSANNAFQNALCLIDEANAQDPQREKAADGSEYPKELLYSRRMSVWLLKLAPQASEVLQLAVRAQHLKRWTTPRETYPMDRAGYLKWRTVLKEFHASECSRILDEAGYAKDFQNRAAALIRKERLKEDPEAQLLEDAACLVFLEFYFQDFASRHEESKIIEIVRKTWNKMSAQARSEALKLPFPAPLQATVKTSLLTPPPETS